MIYILRGVIKNLISTLSVFLQKIPEWIDPVKIKQIILQVPWVKNAHDIHIWSLDGEKNILTSHIVLENSVENIKEVKENIKNILFENNIPHATLEIEYESEHCHDYCK
jgi:cobalt-zinc-cadmium efflux system protein